ncbi:MAG: hypothetical protein IJG57_06520 [Firmicutes bacterium]|jgi:uncharacterized membrane protein|nr:hypothetical protein [Bacillota bacterium]
MYNNRRLALSIFWVVIGLVLVGLSIAEKLDSSMYAGMGGALAAVGALQVIRNLQYRRNEEYREKVDTEVSDERNRFLRMKSWSWTGYIVVLVEAIGVVVAMILGKETVQLVLAYSVCLLVGVYWLSYVVLSRKY